MRMLAWITAAMLAAVPALAQDAEALLRRAEAARDAGLLAEARADLDAAARLAGPGERAAVAAATAEADLAAGDLAAAEQAVEQALAATEPRAQAAAWNAAGALRGARADPRGAAHAYDRARGLAAEAGARLLEATAALNAAREWQAAGDGDAARRGLAAASLALDRATDGGRKAFLRVAQAATILRQDGGRGDPVAARAAWHALDEARRLGAGDARLLSLADGTLARLYDMAGRRDEALALTQRARFAAQELASPDLTLRWSWQEGRQLAALGRRDDAIDAHRRAVDAFRLLRPDLLRAAGGYGTSFRAAAGPLFLDLADLLLRRAAARPETAQPDLVLARDTIERLKAAELEDYFQDDCVASLRARTAGIDRLAPGTAALYPIVLPDRLELLVSFADGLSQVTVPVAGETLRAAAVEFRRQLERRTAGRFLTGARRFHQWLIAPIAPMLARHRIDTLVFVPDGPLRLVPLAALHDGSAFLIERYAVATSPGLTLVEPRPLAGRAVRVLAAGLSQGVQGFPPLPHVAAELDLIARLYPAATLADGAFLAPAVRDQLRARPFTVVHIASHGRFAAEARDSFLLTFDGRLSMDQLEAAMKIGRYRDEPVELLTLSACETAAGDDRAALGLAGVAIKAGARSALASLWLINDQASARLVVAFYRNLAAPGMSKAKALQAAQVGLMRDPRYRHPGYWAPFLLIGNWL